MFTQVAIYTWQLRQRYAKTVKRHGNPCLRFGLYSVSCLFRVRMRRVVK